MKNRVRRTIYLHFFILIISLGSFAQNRSDAHCFQTIEDFGANLDGKTDCSKAIQESLDQNDYAYIPRSKEGAAIYRTINLKPYQKLFGEGRASRIVSHLPQGEFAILTNDVGFGADVKIEDLSLIINSDNSNGIHILRSRNVLVDNVFINGKSAGNIGIHIDGGEEKGSAWNQITRYTILKCKIGIEVSSKTRLNWSNRNFVGYGVVQNCDIGVKLSRANTNTINANPQGCPVGFKLENAKFNRFNSIIENSKTSAILTNKHSNNNIFSVSVNTSKVKDEGKNNTFNLTRSQQKKFDELSSGTEKNK